MCTVLAYSETREGLLKQNFLVVFSCPIDVGVHRDKCGTMLEVLRRRIEFLLHELSDTLKQIQCCVPWDNLPLEHHPHDTD